MQDLNDWISELKTADKLIIVEGKKDKKALEIFGIKNIKILNKSIFELTEEIEKECILLFDLDSEGKSIYSKFRHHLQKRGIKIDKRFREFLFKETKLSHIEGINTYLKNHLTETDLR